MWSPGCRGDGRIGFSGIQGAPRTCSHQGTADAAEHHGTVRRRVFVSLPCRVLTARRRMLGVSHPLMPRLDFLVMLCIAGYAAGLASYLDNQEKQQECGTSGMPAMHAFDCNLMVPPGE